MKIDSIRSRRGVEEINIWIQVPLIRLSSSREVFRLDKIVHGGGDGTVASVPLLRMRTPQLPRTNRTDKVKSNVVPLILENKRGICLPHTCWR